MNIKLFTTIIAVLALFIIVYALYSGKNCKSCEKYEGLPVWAYWEPNPPPKKVKKCYNNWKEVGKLNNINLLNPDNITKYIPEDEYKKICKNADNLAVKSDFIGLYLLSTYGGIWIDSTVFLNKPEAKLKDIIDELNSWEYYQNKTAQPIIRVGSSTDYAGKIEVLMAGGTNGGVDVYKSYFEAGVGTIIAMHVPEDVKKAVAEQNIGNIIIAPHMPSDSIGLLEIVNAWRSEGVEVTTMSGIVE